MFFLWILVEVLQKKKIDIKINTANKRNDYCVTQKLA